MAETRILPLTRAVPVPTDAIIAHRSPDTFYDEKGKLLMYHRRYLALLGSMLFAVSMLFALTPAAFADVSNDASASDPTLGVITCHAAVTSPAIAGNTAQAVGSVSCSSAVASLNIFVALFRDNVEVKSASTILALRSYIFAIPKYTCKTALHIHHFFASMSATIVFPPGYVPHSRLVTLASGTSSLAC